MSKQYSNEQIIGTILSQQYSTYTSINMKMKEMKYDKLYLIQMQNNYQFFLKIQILVGLSEIDTVLCMMCVKHGSTHNSQECCIFGRYNGSSFPSLSIGIFCGTPLLPECGPLHLKPTSKYLEGRPYDPFIRCGKISLPI